MSGRLASVQMVTSASSSGSGTVSHSVSCPASTVLVGGGALLSGQNDDELASSYPSSTGVGGTWSASADRRMGSSTLTVYALCAPLSP